MPVLKTGDGKEHTVPNTLVVETSFRVKNGKLQQLFNGGGMRYWLYVRGVPEDTPDAEYYR